MVRSVRCLRRVSLTPCCCCRTLSFDGEAAFGDVVMEQVSACADKCAAFCYKRGAQVSLDERFARELLQADEAAEAERRAREEADHALAMELATGKCLRAWGACLGSYRRITGVSGAATTTTSDAMGSLLVGDVMALFLTLSQPRKPLIPPATMLWLWRWPRKRKRKQSCRRRLPTMNPLPAN